MAVYVTHGERDPLAKWIVIGGHLREHVYSRRTKPPAIIYVSHKKPPSNKSGAAYTAANAYTEELSLRGICTDASTTQTKEPGQYQQ